MTRTDPTHPSAPVSAIRGAGSPDGPLDLLLADGVVVGATRSEDAPAVSDSAGLTVEAGGAVVVPAFVDAHVHLDKAHLYGAAGTAPAAAGLDEALDAIRALRRSDVAEALIADGARQGVASLVSHGVVAARAHVEIDGVVGLDLLDLHLALREEFAGQIDLQLSAFPQNGIDRTVAALMTSALRAGAEVVGGCPYVDPDPLTHLDTVFALAERFGRPVDLHLDFDDDPAGSLIAAVAERTLAHGMQGQVTLGHVTKLAAMTPADQRRSFALMADTGMSLVVMPATDLYLCGAGEPGHRSLAPLERAAALGVRVAVSNNNLRNPFSPYGNGDLLLAAWTAGLTRRLADRPAHRMLWEAITSAPAAILDRPAHGPAVGALADLVLLDTEDPLDLVLQSPSVLASLRRGHLVHQQRRIAVRASRAGRQPADQRPDHTLEHTS